MMRKLILLICVSWLISSAKCRSSSGCSWTGTMSGYLASGDCPSPDVDNAPDNCTVTPSYSQVTNLWACPDGNDESASNVCKCGITSECTQGSGDTNPLCSFDMTDDDPGCCCALDGCYVTPQFNWIISTCQGSGCGAYSSATSTQKYKNIGSKVIVNYIATYQYDSDNKQWKLQADSSFNTDGSKPAFDLVKPYGGLSKSEAWLSPQPGGASAWTWGYYPAGVSGVGPPGVMFVLSTQRSWNFAFYMLNQLTLDRGPAIGYPSDECSITNNNCWSAGNAGEIDFLESVWTVNAGTNDDYRRLYSTQWNQIGRCFIGDMGSTCNADGGWFTESATTNNYFLGTNSDETISYIWVAVVDSVGTFIYRIPGENITTIWPGLSETSADCTLDNRPSIRPLNDGPPCDDSKDGYCALFIPNCQATSWGGSTAGASGAANEGCKTTSVQGWCNNWWNLFDDTNQWLWPENGQKSVVQFQSPAPAKEMPWNAEMESYAVDWDGNTQYNSGCCINGKGHCPTV